MVRLPASAVPGNNSGQVVHTHMPLFTKQVMLCGWECNRRSGVALAMHRRLSGLSTYVYNGNRKGD